MRDGGEGIEERAAVNGGGGASLGTGGVSGRD